MAGILPNFLRYRRHENGSIAQVRRVCSSRGAKDRRGNSQYLQYHQLHEWWRRMGQAGPDPQLAALVERPGVYAVHCSSGNFRRVFGSKVARETGGHTL